MAGLPSPAATGLVAALDLLATTAPSDGGPTVRREALYAAGLLLGATVAMLAVMAAATRPKRPHPAEATMELGPEPPAIVDLLTDNYEVTSEAVPATLLDLAARGWVELQAYGADQTMCRLRDRGQGDLLPYERLVLNHLQTIAVDGVVPAEALTTGPEAASAAWWATFRASVIADAQNRGLCRKRWPRWVPGVAWLGVWGAGGLLWASHVQSNDEGLAPLAIAVLAGIVVIGAMAGRVTASKRQTDTPAGVAAGSRWLGVRRYLVDHGDFADQPAAAVAVWDRYLAHAAAMDLAAMAVQQLPLGAEDDKHAWSAVTGEWRPVIVDYPRFEPGWGRHPAAAISLGLLGSAASVGVMWLALRFSSDPEIGGRLTYDSALQSRLGWGALILAGLCLIPLAYAATELWRGLADSFGRTHVSGLVLRTRAREGGLQPPKLVRYFTDPERRGRRSAEPRWYVAVDTGERDRIDAWRVRRRHYLAVHQHQHVQAEITPRLGYVREVGPIGASAGPTIDVALSPLDLDPAGRDRLLAAARALAAERTS